jgi:hypothetical protein
LVNWARVDDGYQPELPVPNGPSETRRKSSETIDILWSY